MWDNLVKDRKIFIDTCSLMHQDGMDFVGKIAPTFKRQGNKFIIPVQCIRELEKHKKTDIVNHIVKLRNEGIFDIRGVDSDNDFADNVFIYVFAKFRLSHKLVLITQDVNLAKNICELNAQESVRTDKKIAVYYIDKGGLLKFHKVPHNHFIDFSGEKEKGEKNKREAEKQQEDEDDDCFCITDKVTTLEDSAYEVSSIPQVGEQALTPKGPIVLTKELGSGGEGIIYETDTPFVAKIYKKSMLTARRLHKLKLLLSKPLRCKGICAPIAPIYNEQQQLVGYLMPRAQGKELQKSVFIKPLFLRHFPNWKKSDTVELCITILDKIRYLHSKNIILGDINPSNILIVSPKEVYFVDTDSYQIEEFPCPVGTINFTAPEIQGKHFASFLRSKGHENYAIATLLFMIMIPGKPPYSQQGGSNPMENITRMDFSYPLGDSSNKKTPDGPWRYIWSHLPYSIKEAFYNTFRKEGNYATEATRLSVDAWLSHFIYYRKLLKTGKMAEQDAMSEELFPDRHKKNKNETYFTCSLCKREIAEKAGKNGYCNDCLKKGVSYPCKRCGATIEYTNYQKYILGSRRHPQCKACAEHTSTEYQRRTCAECGDIFSITYGEKEFYESKQLDLPLRCKSCRGQKKANPGPRSYSPTYTRPTQHDSSWCFITTAVCEYYGYDDDCYELTALRAFRDMWMKNQPDGPQLIAEYYRRAPEIVRHLKASPFYPDLCEHLMRDYILPCVELIENHDYTECLNLYKKMVNELDTP